MALASGSVVSGTVEEQFSLVAIGGDRHAKTQQVLVIASVIFLLAVVVVAIFPGLIARSNPLALRPTESLLPPSLHHLLGTNEYGRGILSTLAYGAGPSLGVGFACAAAGGVVGAVMGISAGFFGGATDQSVMRLNDVLMCFPGLLLALIMVAALGPSELSVIIAVSAASVPTYARVARGATLAVRGTLYIDAAIVSGLSHWRVMTRHVLPNVITPLVVVGTITVGVSIVLAASLSFLGLGPAGGIPDWGRLLADGEAYISSAWWISTFPGIAITLVVVATNLIGDWLRDRLDVRAR